MSRKKMIAIAIIALEAVIILGMAAGMIKQHQVNNDLIQINQGLIEVNENLMHNGQDNNRCSE